MEIQAYLQRLQERLGLYGADEEIVLNITRLKEILEHINSLERNLADLLRITHERDILTRAKPYVDSRTW